MKATCHYCESEYEERKEENFCLIEAGLLMICHTCSADNREKFYKEKGYTVIRSGNNLKIIPPKGD